MMSTPHAALRRATTPLALLLCCLSAAAATLAAQTPRPSPSPQARQAAASILVRWQGKPGVERYRLQLATDQAFNDIVFDRAVVGRQYVVRELPPGRYFWRVAPAVGETGTFSTPAPVEINGGAPGSVAVASVTLPADTGGWRTATGDVLRPVPAVLRTGQVVDLLGVNREGTVFAIDGVSGIALWTARYRPDARRGEPTGSAQPVSFLPVAFKTQDGATAVLVACEGGVRALRGDTGRELWRTALPDHPASGAAADLLGDGTTRLFITTTKTDHLDVLDGRSGDLVASKKLDAEALGPPYPFSFGEQKGVALALKNSRVEIRGADGGVLRAQKMEGGLTTPPLVLPGSMPLLLVGAGSGMAALTLSDLKELGRISTDDDALRGTLSAADLDGDGSLEVVMVTKRGRVALVSTTDGNVKWGAEGAPDAESAAFADLNSDGVLDVIVPGGADFAVGYSGKDGSLIWKVEERAVKGASASASTPRALVVAPSLNGAGFVVGGDPAHTGLRAVELPKGSLKTAAR